MREYSNSNEMVCGLLNSYSETTCTSVEKGHILFLFMYEGLNLTNNCVFTEHDTFSKTFV